MKTLAILISLLSITGLYLFNSEAPLQNKIDEAKIIKEFVAWKSEYGQNFNSHEEEYRYNTFKNNYNFIEQHNQMGESLKLKLTKFAAMTNEEYKATILLRNKVAQNDDEKVNYYKSKGSDIPDSINWQQKGAVYATQDQGSCGSCWAFATIGGLQGLRQIATGTLELLSAQQVTSCVAKEFLDNKNDGCGGGETRYAYDYTAENGIETWNSYPYTDGSPKVKGTSPCEYNKNKVVFYNEGKTLIEPNDVQGIKENLANQPLTIAVDAASIYFQLYSTGVIDSKNCGTDLNHAILLVGMNNTPTTEAEPYWTVQNSWGTGWGNQGFGKIAITQGKGVCGINMQVDFPTSINQKSLIQE